MQIPRTSSDSRSFYPIVVDLHPGKKSPVLSLPSRLLYTRIEGRLVEATAAFGAIIGREARLSVAMTTS